MSIQEVTQKIKDAYANEKVFLAALLLAVAAISFGLGRASVGLEAAGIQKGAVTYRVENQAAVPLAENGTDDLVLEPQEKTAPPLATEGAYVGSKRSDKYHLPWCPGAKAISDENKVWFKDKEDAETKGYTPAANCKGI